MKLTVGLAIRRIEYQGMVMAPHQSFEAWSSKLSRNPDCCLATAAVMIDKANLGRCQIAVFILDVNFNTRLYSTLVRLVVGGIIMMV